MELTRELDRPRSSATPLYNYISLNLEKDRDAWLLQLLNTPQMQRLRWIHQLGVSSFTCPGADHNRLAHSLGVLHLRTRLAAGRGAGPRRPFSSSSRAWGSTTRSGRERLLPLTAESSARVRYYVPKDVQADAIQLRTTWK